MNAVYLVWRPRGFRGLQSQALCLLAACALVAGLLTLAPAASGRRAANLSLVVTFYENGTITVTLPNGTPVGTTSGAATVIPAGYYSVVMNGPGGCAYLPVFELKGPGESIIDDMRGGEWETFTYNANFLANSTYTWRNDANPGIFYTFKTSADVVGTAPANGSPVKTGKSGTVSSQDLAGSAVIPFRGTLTGAVSATGRLTLAFKGKSVATLKAGRYTVAVTDKSSTNGFLLQKLKHTAVSVTGTAFVGKRSTLVRLSAGHWIVAPRVGKTTYSIVVS